MEILLKEYEKYNIQETVNQLKQLWNDSFGTMHAIMLPNGGDGPGSNRPNTTAFFSWLFRCDIPNSVLVLTRKSFFFLGSKEKVNFLQPLSDRIIKECKIQFLSVVRDKARADECMKEFVELINRGLGDLGEKPNFVTFTNEAHHGKIVKEFTSALSTVIDPNIRNGTQDLLNLIAIKRGDDFGYINKSAAFLNSYFGKTIEHLEKVIDSESHPEHTEISSQWITLFDEEKQKFTGIEQDFLELGFAPSIQSGTAFDLKPFSECNSETLNFDVIVINQSVKYFDFNTAAVRTLFVNSTEMESSNYATVFDAQKLLIESLRPGETFASVYETVARFIKEKNRLLGEKLQPSFGNGIGIEFREAHTQITPKNHLKIEEGMVIYAYVVAKELVASSGKIYGIMLADTVLVEENETKILTNNIPKKFKSISYSLQIGSTPNRSARSQDGKSSSKKSVIASQASIKYAEDLPPSNVITRGKKKYDEGSYPLDKTVMVKVQEHQTILLKQKVEELKSRLRKGDFNFDFGSKDHIKLVNIQAYRSRDEVPKKQGRNKIEVDIRNDVVWLPIGKSMVPFSIAVIKNVSLQHEGHYTSLRINFNIPLLTNKMHIIFPQGIDFNPIYLREVTYKSSMRQHFEDLKQIVKAMIRDFAATVELRNVHDSQIGGLIPTVGKKPVMEDLKMWPPFSGKKTYGRLELHKNGFKFRSTKNEEIDLLFMNIKNAVYQPSEGEEIILLHFNLKHPVIVGRKKTADIQFYAEVGLVPEDLYDIRTRRGRDFPEEEEDRLYEEHRANLDRAFGGFVESVERETNNQIKFDVPLRNIGFPGIYETATEMIYPTINCLVSLTRNPYLVLSIDEIEVVVFERTGFMNKTFDMVIIFKDYAKPVKMINGIPARMRDVLKVWLDSVDVIFIEGRVNLNWNKIMKRICQDLEKFVYDENAWISFSDYPEFRDDDDGDSDVSDLEDYDVRSDSQRDAGSETSDSEEHTENKMEPHSSYAGEFDSVSRIPNRRAPAGGNITASATKVSDES